MILLSRYPILCAVVALIAATGAFAPPPFYHANARVKQILRGERPPIPTNPDRAGRQIEADGPLSARMRALAADHRQRLSQLHPMLPLVPPPGRAHHPSSRVARNLKSLLRTRTRSLTQEALNHASLHRPLTTQGRLDGPIAGERAHFDPAASVSRPMTPSVSSQLFKAGRSWMYHPMSRVEVDGNGLTFDKCLTADDCKGSRLCFDQESAGTLNIRTCDGTGDCVCFPTSLDQCESSAECDEGEVCSLYESARVLGSFCASETVVGFIPGLEKIPEDVAPSEEPTQEPLAEPSGAPSEDDEESEVSPSPESEVCIDARSLHHLSPDNLVFKKHVWAKVLCDENESCATEGHMVTFHGRSMRMKTYCSQIKCVDRVMLVNSPQYSRGLLVNSNTNGLHFTALAAKYNTRIEEVVLAAAVRAGL